MSNIVALTLALIKNGSISGNKKGNKKDKGAYIYFFVLALYVLVFSAPIVMVLDEILATYNFSELILSIIIPTGGITAIVFAIFSMASMFYYSEDIEKLVPFPVKSGELFMAKFLSSLTSVYLVLFMFIFPIIYGVGVGIDAGVYYYVYATIICVLMPIIPSALICVIFMILSRVVNLGKRKTLFMYITVGLVMTFSLVYGLGIGYLLDMGSVELVNLLSGPNVAIKEASQYIFPFFNSAKYALVNSEGVVGVSSIGTFIGLNIVFLLIIYFLGEKFYLKGLTKYCGSRKNKLPLEKVYKKDKGGVLRAFIRREWKIIQRTPVYMLNIVVLNLTFPIIFLITYLVAPKSEMLLEIDFNNPGVYLIVVAVIMFMSDFCGSTGSSSAISREGKSATFMKTIPVSVKTQIDSKIYLSSALNFLVAIIAEVCLMFLFKMPWIYLVLVNVPLIFLILSSNYVNVLLDLKRPKVTWSDESEAVKQNITVLIAMMLSMLFTGIIVFAGIVLINYEFSIYLVSLLFTIVALVCYILLAIYIKVKGIKLLDKVM